MKPFKYRRLQWPRDVRIYKGPLLLVQQSLQDDRLASAISNGSVVYSSSYFGIPFGATERSKYEALCVYLNSSLAAYLFMLTATRLGIDKQIVMPNDVQRLPFSVNARSEDYQVLADLCKPSSNIDRIDETVFDFFGLDPWQRAYVTDTVKYDLAFVRHGNRTSVANVADDTELEFYANTIVNHLRSNLSSSELTVNADIVTGLSDLRCVEIRFGEGVNRSVRSTSGSEDNFSTRIAELLHAPLTTGIQLRRSLIHFDEDRCIIVKLAQKRFWSRARAYDDADAIFGELCRVGD